MRRGRVTAGLAAGALATLLVASVALAKPVTEPREVVKDYVGARIVNWDWPTGGGGGTAQLAGIEFQTRRGESWVSMSVTDVTGQPVGAFISQNRPKGQRNVWHRFCGSTEEPVRITGGRSIWVYVASCTDPGIAVAGKVVATFTR